MRDAAGNTQELNLKSFRDQHIEHAYCTTTYAAQGKTADRMFLHLESFRINLANQQSFYVAVSRARDEVHIYTDDRRKLIHQIERESGEKAMANDVMENQTPIMLNRERNSDLLHENSGRGDQHEAMIVAM